MKVFFLDNEYTDYIVLAEDLDRAWEKLRKIGIARPEENIWDDPDVHSAYNDMYEVEDGYTVDNPHDLHFVL
jgi:hypothetical protein